MKARFTKNKSELARELNITREGLYGFMAQQGWPEETSKGWNIDECREFVLKNTEKDAIAAGLDSDIADLKKWEIYERARKSKLSNDHRAETLIRRSDHQAQISEMASEVQKRMYAIPPRAPELAGLSVPDIEAKLTAWMDEIVAALGNDRTKPNAEPVES
jgi:hypothetical protein